MKNIMTEMKNPVENVNIKLTQEGERNSEL
jgi:hypothetical protein